MKKVLVTGGSGFLGSHVIDMLVTEGYNVIIIDINPPEFYHASVEYVHCDLFKDSFPTSILKDCSIIFHLAGFADLNAARTSPIETVTNNILVTTKLLKAAVENEIERFIFASTVYVYSHQGGFYKASKQACEIYIEEFHKKYGLEFTILRYGSLYGPRSDERNGIYKLLKQAVLNSKIDFYGSPDEKREYINIVDAARLSVQCIKQRYRNSHYIITGQQSISAEELFTMFSEILNKKIQVNYRNEDHNSNSGHYKMTPYNYLPKVGEKLTSNISIDIGQGLIQLIQEIT
jgi:UDP-glucose 4-epimerase